jgi:hypothetical protein
MIADVTGALRGATVGDHQIRADQTPMGDCWAAISHVRSLLRLRDAFKLLLHLSESLSKASKRDLFLTPASQPSFLIKATLS